jgi:hypothetical protein
MEVRCNSEAHVLRQVYTHFNSSCVMPRSEMHNLLKWKGLLLKQEEHQNPPFLDHQLPSTVSARCLKLEPENQEPIIS